MALIVDKCSVMSTTHSRTEILFQYTIGNEVLNNIILDDKLSLNECGSDYMESVQKCLDLNFVVVNTSRVSLACACFTLVLSEIGFSTVRLSGIQITQRNLLECFTLNFESLIHVHHTIND